MSVLIKGMEMPETCSDCEWSYYVGNGRAMCRRVSMTDKTDIMTKRRADFCPLIEVHTPHGRLIDADEFKDYIRSGYEAMKHLFNENLKAATLVTEGFCKDIDEAPTVIEAEGTE